jgi:hypothetical protein
MTETVDLKKVKWQVSGWFDVMPRHETRGILTGTVK